MNLTKTLRKAPIDVNLDRQGPSYEEQHKAQPKYDDEDKWVSEPRRRRRGGGGA